MMRTCFNMILAGIWMITAIAYGENRVRRNAVERPPKAERKEIAKRLRDTTNYVEKAKLTGQAPAAEERA